MKIRERQDRRSKVLGSSKPRQVSPSTFNWTLPKVSEGAPWPGGCVVGGGCVVVARCNSIVGFAVWWVMGAVAEPDSSCCDTVPPQLPTPTALSMVLESTIGFKHSLLTAAA